MDISVLIPAINECENLKILLPLLSSNLSALNCNYEIIIIEGGNNEDIEAVAGQFGARAIRQSAPGFGSALQDGFRLARGEFIITMDADLSHNPTFIKKMWDRRADAELIIASRYCPGGSAQMSLFRRILSWTLNQVFSGLLSLEVKDLSSNFRMYRKSALDSIAIRSRNFDVLEEILLRIYSRGWRITEVPFRYEPRIQGRSHVRLLRFGKDYLKTLYRMWELRNSIHCADYDMRAFYSKIPLQRFWQRKRYWIIRNFTAAEDNFLDIGCGSSKIIIDHPQAVALDISLDKLRYLRSTNKILVNADAGKLPFKDGCFKCVVCSEVIEHSRDNNIIPEIYRVLGQGGLLVIGTPDYGKIMWRLLEFLYSIFHRGGYADEHVTHYTAKELKDSLEGCGFKILDHAYICDAELIMKTVKPKGG